MATPVTLRLLSGDLLVIHPTPSDNWALLAWRALPKAERPAHPGKIRILPGVTPEEYTLWMDPPTRVLFYKNDRRIVTDGQHEYIRAGVALEEDEMVYDSAYFFYRYDPLGPVEHILYRAKDVQYKRGRYMEEDHLTIPDGVQPVPVDQFLPREWYDLLEDCEEVWRGTLEDLRADYVEQYIEEDDDAMEEEFVERMMNQRPAFMERVGQ